MKGLLKSITKTLAYATMHSYGAIEIAVNQLEKEENYTFFVEKLCIEGSRKVWIFEKQGFS